MTDTVCPAEVHVIGIFISGLGAEKLQASGGG
jgi:hypothetical protein